MKKLIILIGMLIIVLPSSVEAFAQNSQDNIVIESEGDDAILSIAGFQFTFGENKKPEVKPVKRAPTPLATSKWLSNLRYGFNHLNNNILAPLRNGASFHFSIELTSIELFINRSRTVSLETGIQYVYSDIVFQDKISLRNVNGILTTFPVYGEVKKSKLAAYYIGVPLHLNISLGGGTEMSLTGYVNYLTQPFTKVKGVSGKEYFDGLKDFQYGVGASVTYDGFGIFCMYALSPLFEEGLVNSNLQALGNERLLSFGLNLKL